MNPTREDIESYLADMKALVTENRFRIERNDNRQKNLKLFVQYVISERKAKDIILSLKVTDFSEVRRNTKQGYEHELLYIFGKDVKLLEKAGNQEITVPLYIKFNKLGNQFIIVVSFHEQEFPLHYQFK